MDIPWILQGEISNMHIAFAHKEWAKANKIATRSKVGDNKKSKHLPG